MPRSKGKKKIKQNSSYPVVPKTLKIYEINGLLNKSRSSVLINPESY